MMIVKYLGMLMMQIIKQVEDILQRSREGRPLRPPPPPRGDKVASPPTGAAGQSAACR